MTDINSKPANSTQERILGDKEKLVLKKQSEYDAVSKTISNQETKILNDQSKIDRLATVILDGSPVEVEKAKAERETLKKTIHENSVSIKTKTTANASLMRQINRLKEEVINDSKGMYAINIETITKTKISDVEKGIVYLLQITNTDNFQDFITDVKKKFTSFE
ncbi:hypothetical protein AU074_13755 [Pseudomonas sp. ATCC PTA-122608]|uniref:hypothetical protein n=1 Tax=Pseudomonas sp. ATCC PTA-122608 TaxID=1771311 RepID=UPI00096B91AD|nr:hypothetical protein [Pseudomonas sp. ATCC PTA-122608]OLY72235.1 hypothetical protein AU074_13755 [Pseudomonas sp. ATCC PTA-122608]